MMSILLLKGGTEFLDGIDPSDEEYFVSDGWLTLYFILNDGQTNE